MSNKVQVTDVILRDAHQSLIATRMRTEDMLPICEKLDGVGYWSLECWGGATFDACLRFLKEDPWERLRKLRQALPNTRLQMLLRGQNLLGYRHYSDGVVRAFVRKSAENGMDVFRIFDALNDLRNLRTAIEATKEADKHAQGTISYTVSPVHDVAGFVTMGRELEAMGCDSICIKDMAGLLTPYATAELVKALTDAVDLPLHLHCHATAGQSEMCQLKAIENGCRHIDTAISSFAGGTSHPPTESLVAALRGTEYDTALDLEAIQEIGLYFYGVRKKYHQFESDYTGVDTRVQVNQVPGGMISNLANQLREQNALDRMSEVLVEIPAVREDLGYPPLVTPTSQIVGTQAVLNVLTGKRYQTITNEVKLYLQGGYGLAPAVVNPTLQQQAVGSEELVECRPADLLQPELDRLHREIIPLAQCEEDVLSFAMFPEVGRKFLEEREAGTLRPETLEPIPSSADNSTAGIAAPTEFNINLHGESYNIKVTGAGHRGEAQRHFYFTVDGVPEEVLIETLSEVVLDGGAEGAVKDSIAGKRPQPSAEGHVTTSMPGNIVEVLVSEGDKVEMGQPILVTEAMKMETEVQSPIAGLVKKIYVQNGDAVSPDETLVEIEDES
ncbi:MAG: sodium-extruding oxaloacetate decarboxylase subunit alpha [Candidatus Thiodiazotropha sp. (ex Lucina aurantia)]|nr:sodium-extruding oxaloacetate decarboxylase subunit alpha [Candidatus Thiodiazotropha taylori]MBV2097430.1 sodium-extruding oxaloacetate decarboxylase subunit alpha [Candidatus Thiodiazotropha sp. (ex Codakia orbicularis)]MBV2102196.1 sodium-extruding oxaloacetate decarboxylase subunit alpha [Candidatus Thiodiazotropha sp. (ex Lucina aurantia)]MBV2116824.1 sodium-extruding oxaloacetate decarboxylase subunit alpha [Candidatus Thiodiazotropha sp. (ex Lucina aurantia)]